MTLFIKTIAAIAIKIFGYTNLKIEDILNKNLFMRWC